VSTRGDARKQPSAGAMAFVGLDPPSRAAGRCGDAQGVGLSSRVECLRCGPAGELRRVAVVYRDGRDVVRVRGQAFGMDGAGVVPVRARAVRVSELARVLSPPRRPPSVVVPAALLGAAVLFLMVVAGMALTTEGGSAVWPAAVPLLVIGAACACLVWARRHGSRVSGRDVGRARWLWARCWYCRRCGLVSLVAPSVVSQLLPAAGLAGSLFEVAGRLRWRPTSGGR
jgi:hypothetical protein